MQFIISSKGKRQLVLDGYFYKKQKTLAVGVISGECAKRRNKRSCAARVKTNDGRIIGRVNEHNYIMKPDRIQSLRVRAIMREGDEAARERLRNIIIDGVYGQDNAVLAQLPAPASMTGAIRRQRQRVNINKPIPDVFFNIPDQYRTTSTGELFLQYDLQINNQRLLIFGSAEGVNFLSEAPHWFVDGTFETVPPQFTQ